MKKTAMWKRILAVLMAAMLVLPTVASEVSERAFAAVSGESEVLRQVSDAVEEIPEEDPGKKIAGNVLGTRAIKNPEAPGNADSPWTGSYVYYGQYEVGEGDNKTWIPVRYRVLDPDTDRFSEEDESGKTAHTMLLDCDSVLYQAKFDEDGEANTGAQKPNEWEFSDVKKGLNGDKFLDKENVFTKM